MNKTLKKMSKLLCLGAVAMTIFLSEAHAVKTLQVGQQVPLWQPLARYQAQLEAKQTSQQKNAALQKRKHHSSSTASHHSHSYNEKKWDYIIVGGGTTGCALAAKLSDPVKGKYKYSVLMIEAGENLTKDPRVVDTNNIVTAIAEALDPALSIVSLTYPLGQDVNPFFSFAYTEGRMWGGSSGHNYLQCIRATPDELAQWVALSGDPRWAYSNLIDTVIKPLEHYTPDGSVANPTQRGFNGPLFITQEPFETVANDSFYQAVATAAGIPIVTDYNDPDQGVLGVSSNQDYVTPPFLGENSIRSFSGNAFLTGEPSVGVAALVDENGNGLHGRKLKVVSNAHANRVVFKNRTAKGVEYVHADAPDVVITAQAKKGVILCAGGVADPAILQRSGIGDPDLLNSLDIPVVYANPNVGNNMQCFVGQQGVIGGVETAVELPAYGVSFLGFDPNPNERQFYAEFFSQLAAFPLGIADALQISGINALGANLTPKSRGSVQIISKDPFIQPLINFNYFSDGPASEPGTDAYKVISFYNLLQGIASEAGGEVLYPTAAQYAAGDDALLGAALATLLPFNHISSTCQMARTPATGVIDGKLRVFGVKKLMVASSASEPVSLGGQQVCMMLGLEAGRILRGE